MLNLNFLPGTKDSLKVVIIMFGETIYVTKIWGAVEVTAIEFTNED